MVSEAKVEKNGYKPSETATVIADYNMEQSSVALNSVRVELQVKMQIKGTRPAYGVVPTNTQHEFDLKRIAFRINGGGDIRQG